MNFMITSTTYITAFLGIRVPACPCVFSPCSSDRSFHLSHSHVPNDLHVSIACALHTAECIAACEIPIQPRNKLSPCKRASQIWNIISQTLERLE